MDPVRACLPLPLQGDMKMVSLLPFGESFHPQCLHLFVGPSSPSQVTCWEVLIIPLVSPASSNVSPPLTADVSVAALALPVTSDDLEVFLPACVHLSRAPSSPVLQPTADDGLPELLFPFTCRSCGTVLDEGSPQDDDGEMDGQFCSRCSSSGSPDKCFSCVLCPFVTHYQNHLSRHMKTHSGEKPYKCHLCSYASAHYDNLKRHQRVHTGEKPYKCQLCDYACGNLANLKRHGRIHSGDKPFRCGLCNYSCNQSMNLKRHMLRHTGEKPLRCPQCHYTTGHWDNYKRHQKTHGHSGGLSEPPRSDGS